MSDEPKYRDEEWLREQYEDEGLSTYGLAEKCECSRSTISRWLKKHGIETPDEGADYERLADASWVREKYVEQGCSMREIAKSIGCALSTVGNWIDRHGIETQGSKHTPERLTDAGWLRDQYKNKNKNIIEIAEECGCSNSSVARWLKRHRIERRSQSSLNTGRNNPNWNGGTVPYGVGWNEQKKREVRERDDLTCQDANCSMTQAEHLNERGEKLHVHHLRKARDVDDPEERNAPENLITLCRDCHNRWEKIADTGLVPQLDTAGEAAD